MSATRARQVGRAAAAAVVLLTTALLAHRVMGGAQVPASGLGLGALVAFLAGGFAARRDRSLAALAAVALVGQTALHALFALTPFGGGHGGTLARLLCGHGHLDGAAAAALHTGAARAALATAPAPGLGSAVPMLAGHVAAAVLLLAWMRGGERYATRVLRSIRVRLILLLSVVVPARHTMTPPRRRPRPAGRWTSLGHVVIRRGPPVPAC